MNFFGRLFCLIGLLSIHASSFAAEFEDVTEEAGLDLFHTFPLAVEEQQPYMTGGAAAGDFDGDGWVDLYVTRPTLEDKLYRNLGDGTFENVSATAFGPDHLVGVRTNGASWGDIDNDGDLDLYVTTYDHPQHLLYINNGEGAFTEEAVARGADVPDAAGLRRFGFSSSFGDYDGDGYLDLHVTEWRLAFEAGGDSDAIRNTRLLRNLGKSSPGHFEDVTNAAGVAMEGVPASTEEIGNAESFVSRFSDIDRDGHPDLLLVADHNASRLFWNNGDGTFTDGTLAANVGTDHNGMGSALGDIDGDGDFDWFVTSIYGDPETYTGSLQDRNGNRLFRYDGNRSFTDITDAAGVRNGRWGWAAVFFDYDHDGDVDLAMSNGMNHPVLDFDGAQGEGGYQNDQSVLWENDGTGVFNHVSDEIGFSNQQPGKGMLTFDYDRDGDLDVFIVNNGAATSFKEPVLFRNNGGNDKNWLRIELVGTISNSQAVGTFVTITKDLDKEEIMLRELNASNHFLGQSETALHYGLGDSEMVDQIKFEWRDGSVTHMKDIPANQTLSVTQPQVTTGKVVDVALGGVVDFTVMAVDEVTSMAASGLPEGVHLDSGTFALSGSPSRAGRFEINLDGARADGNSSGSIILNVTTTYADWIDAFFPGESDQAIIGVSADPDGDGRGNVEEYAAQSNPSVVDTGLRFEFDLKRDSEAALPTASFSTFSSSTDLTHVVEESTDLVSWTPWGGATELSRVDEGNGIETVTLQRASALGDDEDVFVRVRRVVASSD